MNILVAYGSERGGTAGIASQIADALRDTEHKVDVCPAGEAQDVSGYDAVIIGGALYAMCWHRDARRFVLRHAETLRGRLVWFFSSGPLDDSASRTEIPPTWEVKELMDLVGAEGHATFGGRLTSDAQGFIASRMARTHAGDWRDPAHIVRWARGVAQQITPGAWQRESRPVPRPLPSLIPGVALGLFVGVTATVGGAALIARPDGAGLHLPARLLQHSPFHDFLVPGLLLFVFVGLTNLGSVSFQIRRHPLAPVAEFVAGGALLVWIVVQMILLRMIQPLQLGFLLLGIVIVARSIREGRRLATPLVHAAPAH